MKHKRGQVGNLQGLIAVLIVVGVLIAVAFFVIDEFQTQLDDEAGSVTAESGGYINESGYTLAAATEQGFNSPSITSAINTTSGQTILAGNYTVSSTGVVTNASTTNWEAVNFTYTYLKGGNGYNAVNLTAVAMLTIPEILGIVILIFMVAVILAVVFNVIPGARVGGA